MFSFGLNSMCWQYGRQPYFIHAFIQSPHSNCIWYDNKTVHLYVSWPYFMLFYIIAVPSIVRSHATVKYLAQLLCSWEVLGSQLRNLSYLRTSFSVSS